MICIVIFSLIYNGFLSLGTLMEPYKITGYIGAKNHVFMRAAALGTWFGDFLTAWMVTDMMLQVRISNIQYVLSRHVLNQGLVFTLVMFFIKTKVSLCFVRE